MTNTEHRTEEPRSDRGAPGSRGVGSPGLEGEVDRPAGAIEHDEDTDPNPGDDGPHKAPGTAEFTTQVSGGAEAAVPPYDGRQTSGDHTTGDDASGGTGTSSAQPATPSDTDTGVGPTHETGVGRAEDKL